MIQVNNNRTLEYQGRFRNSGTRNRTIQGDTSNISSDTYKRINTREEPESSTTQNINSKIIENLSAKYDVKNLTGEEKTKLLKELKDLGLISEKDFNIAKYTQVPLRKSDGSSSVSYAPDSVGGKQLSKTDWKSNYEVIGEYLESCSKEDLDPQYKDTYSKLVKIMEKLDSSNIIDENTQTGLENIKNQDGLTKEMIEYLSDKYNTKETPSDKKIEFLGNLRSKGVLSERGYQRAVMAENKLEL